MLSRRDVQRMTGVSTNTLYMLEHGKRRPQTTTIRRLLNIYAIHISKLERLAAAWQTPKGTQRETNLA